MVTTGKKWLSVVLSVHLLIFFSSLSIPYRRGARPEKHQDAASGIIRAILITLDELKFTEKTENGGRRITKIGQQALDLVAGQIANGDI